MRDGKLNKLYQRLWKEGKPVSAMVEITTRCNLHCQFCYVADNHREQYDIPKGKLFRIIDQLAEMGCMQIILLGGEPFIRKDFLDIYNYIAKNGIFIEIYSNGTLLRKDVLKEMKQYPFHRLRISLYGASGQTYRELSGSSLAFRQTIKGIKLAKREGINFRLYTVWNKINQKDSAEIKKLVKKFGAIWYSQTHLTAKSDGDTSPYKLSIARRPQKRICKGCIFIDNLARLDSCPVIREPNYNLSCISFQSAWQKRLRDRLRIKCPCR